MMYRVGLSMQEVREETLNKSGLHFVLVTDPRAKIMSSVKGVVGVPYKRGASVLRDAPDAFDCSSLTAWAAVEAGCSIPRVSIDQFVFTQRIQKEDLEPGDLVFANTKEIVHTEGIYFSQVLGKEVHEEPIRTETLEYMPGTKVPEGVDHVGVYVGNGRIIHATSKKGGVVEENLNESASFQNIVGFGRIIDTESSRCVVTIPDDRPDLRKKDELLRFLNNIQ